MHAALGIAGEGGEIIDLVKKVAINGKAMNRGHLIEELGDLEFYLQLLRTSLGIDRQEVLQVNLDKLATRYPAGYSDQAAAARVDLLEVQAPYGAVPVTIPCSMCGEPVPVPVDVHPCPEAELCRDCTMGDAA
jgi:NTP pyrophosphatase (non-canonical NTP hydrolase)